MTDEIYRSWEFDVPSAEECKEMLESDLVPPGYVRIFTEESSENSDRLYIDDALFGVHVSEFIETIPAVLNDERRAVRLNTITIHFRRVTDKQAVEVRKDMHDVSDDIVDYEPDLIETEAFVAEMYHTGKSWYDNAKAINPDLVDHDWFQDIEAALENAEAAMEQADIDHSSLGSDG